MNAQFTKQTLIPVIIAVLSILPLAGCDSLSTNALRGTSWRLAFLTGKDVLSGTAITIRFTADQISGSAGCNHYEGNYKTSGNSLSVSDVFATEMGCLEPRGILEQEQELLSALRVAARYEIDGDRLEILDETGRQILVFVPSN